MTSTTQKANVIGKFVERSGELYSLPAVALEVLELTRHPNVDARAIKECIERDPALTVKILRVVNSSLFGLSRQVTDLNHALALIGAKPLKLLVLGFSLPKELFDGIEGEVLSHYWRHTLVKAVAAREISERFWNQPGDEPFIAGLLQGIGMLVLLQQLGEPYAKFLQKVNDDGSNLLALETATLGFDHFVLSSRLLEHWGLPELLVRAVAIPHRVDRLIKDDAGDNWLAQILHLADLFAVLLGQKRASALNELLHAGGIYRGLTIETLYPLLDDLEEKIAPLTQAMSIAWSSDEDFHAIVEQAYRQISSAADVAAEQLMSGDRLESAILQQTGELSGAIADYIQNGDIALSYSSKDSADSRLAADRCNPKSAEHALRTDARPVADEIGLLSQVTSVVAACRLRRKPVSLATLEVDNHADLLLVHGPAHTEHLIQFVETAALSLAEDEAICMRIGEARFVVVLEEFDRYHAVSFVRRLVHGVRDWSRTHCDNSGGSITLSAGVATLAVPPKNFPAQELIDAADQCLNGAQLSGGDTVKSIDIG